MAILISEKIDFRAANIIKDKEQHLIVIKAWNYDEDIGIVNV